MELSTMLLCGIIAFVVIFAIASIILTFTMTGYNRGNHPIEVALILSMIITVVLGIGVALGSNAGSGVSPLTRSHELNIAEMNQWYGEGIIIRQHNEEEGTVYLCPRDVFARVRNFRGQTIVNTQGNRIVSIYQP